MIDPDDRTGQAVDWARRFISADESLTSVYVDVMVPRLFAPWAEVLVDALAPAPASTVLDVATGPGTVARALARRVGRIGRVLACDISPGMLAAAQQIAADSRAAPIEYTQCPADAMPFADGLVAGVTCQHGLQFFPDRVAGLAEMRRVTQPGGRLAVAVWRSLDHVPAQAAAYRAAATLLGVDVATDSGPWSLGDPTELAGLAAAAGWQDVEVVARDLPIEYEGGPGQVVATLAVGPMADRLAALDEQGRRDLLDLTTDLLGPTVEADGAVRSSTGANFLLATA